MILQSQLWWALTFKVFSFSLFFGGDCNSPARALGDMVPQPPAWAAAFWMLGSADRSHQAVSPKPPTTCRETGPRDSTAHSLKNLAEALWKNQPHCSRNSLKMKTSHNARIRSAKLNQLVLIGVSMQMTSIIWKK